MDSLDQKALESNPQDVAKNEACIRFIVKKNSHQRKVLETVLWWYGDNGDRRSTKKRFEKLEFWERRFWADRAIRASNKISKSELV